MDKTLLNIQMLYPEMGKSEKRVADYILSHVRDLLPLSITELAEKSQSSEATIVRFSRRLGLSGYQELKIVLAKESGHVPLNPDVSPEDSCYDIFCKVTEEVYRSLEMTKRSLSPEAMIRAGDALLHARKIAIFGLGNSAPVAQDAGHKFFRAGCDATACSDNHMQVIAASHMNDRDVALGISHSGSSRDIIDALSVAKERGATTIAITNHGKSPIVKVSEIVLYTASQETEYTILGLNSRIAALSIIDALYSYIVCHKEHAATEAIENVERALKSKKY